MSRDKGVLPKHHKWNPLKYWHIVAYIHYTSEVKNFIIFIFRNIHIGILLLWNQCAAAGVRTEIGAVDFMKYARCQEHEIHVQFTTHQTHAKHSIRNILNVCRLYLYSILIMWIGKPWSDISVNAWFHWRYGSKPYIFDIV